MNLDNIIAVVGIVVRLLDIASRLAREPKRLSNDTTHR